MILLFSGCPEPPPEWVSLAGVEAGTLPAVRSTPGEQQHDHFGFSVSTGDMDGDGQADIAVGAPDSDLPGRNGGAVYLFLGGVLPTSAADADHVVRGESALDGFGSSVNLHDDLDGDGRQDLLVGAPDSDAAGPSSGRVYGLLRPLEEDAFDIVVDGPTGWRLFTAGLLGDLDGSGRSELGVGAPARRNPGDYSLQSGSWFVLGDAGSGTWAIEHAALSGTQEDFNEGDWPGATAGGAAFTGLGDRGEDGLADGLIDGVILTGQPDLHGAWPSGPSCIWGAYFDGISLSPSEFRAARLDRDPLVVDFFGQAFGADPGGSQSGASWCSSPLYTHADPIEDSAAPRITLDFGGPLQLLAEGRLVVAQAYYGVRLIEPLRPPQAGSSEGTYAYQSLLYEDQRVAWGASLASVDGSALLVGAPSAEGEHGAVLGFEVPP